MEKKNFLVLFLIVFLGLTILNFVSAATNVTGCGTLNTTNEVYTLNQSISSSFDCLIINATNITLDCAGYNITYGNASGGRGIAVVDEDTQLGFNNVTIKNCLVIQNESGVNESAIFFGEGSENGVAYNNTIIVYGNGTSGILFEESSVGANISLNNITTSGGEAYGIYLGMDGSEANIESNIVTISGNDSSGVLVDADSITLFNNTITNSGNRSSGGVVAGIFLEEGTSDMNVSSNNINTSGTDGAGIWIWGSNSSFDNNVITASGELGDGIYLNDVQGVNLTSNTMDISGVSAIGIHSVMSEESSLIFYNNVITTSADYSDGIYLKSDSYNNISLNNITTSGSDSYGIYFNESHSITLAQNRIKTTGLDSYVLYLLTSADETFYDNIFNTSTSGSGVYFEDADVSYFNTTNTTSTNIVGKNYIGGNFWTNDNGTGYSDTCTNFGGDYFCDSAYVVVSGLDNTDYLPLTTYTNLGPPTVLHFEQNTTVNYDQEGNFTVNWTAPIGDVVNYSVYIYVDGSLYTQTVNDSVTGYTFSNTTNNNANYTFYVAGVNATDSREGTNSTNISIFILDTIAPTATFSCSPSSVSRGSTVTCTCSGTDSGSGINSSATSAATTPSTSSTGTFTATGCSVTDYAGNSDTATDTYTVTSSSSGGGTAPTYEWSLQKRHSWSKITSGAVAIMKDFDGEMGLKQIQIEVHTEAQNVGIVVSRYDSKPAEVSIEKSGKTYRYLHINAENLEGKLERATIRMQVEKSWMIANGFEIENMVMFKFNEDSNKWDELDTAYVESDGEYYYYDAEVDSFSYFAISEKVVVDDEEDGIGEDGEEELEKKGLGWWWVAIIVGVIILFYLISANKKTISKLLKK